MWVVLYQVECVCCCSLSSHIHFNFCLISWFEWLLGGLWVLLSLVGSLYCLLTAFIMTGNSFFTSFLGKLLLLFFPLFVLILVDESLILSVLLALSICSCCRGWEYSDSTFHFHLFILKIQKYFHHCIIKRSTCIGFACNGTSIGFI